MGKYISEFFSEISKRLPKNILLVDEVSDILGISYDASYRRINRKTSLSLEEAMKLAEHYEISLNDLLKEDKKDNLYADKVSFNGSKKGLQDFYKKVAENINEFSKLESSQLIIAAREIPVYHIPSGSLYSRFRTFTYLNILTNFSKELPKKISNFFVGEQMLFDSTLFKKSFREIKVTEIWSDSTINNCLYQIFYFFKIKSITKEEAIIMCDEISLMVKSIEKQAALGYWSNDKKVKFCLYHNKILTLNNLVYLKSYSKNVVLMPYSSLSYVRLLDKNTCNEVDEYFDKTIRWSSKILGNVEINSNLFFSAMYERIEGLKKEIEAENGFSFAW